MYADIILESFSLNPFSELYDFSNIITESSIAEFNDFITEATTGVNKGNILQRLISIIVKSVKWIFNHLKRLWNFIKNLFSKNKKCKSADQVVDEVLQIEAKNSDLSSVDVKSQTNKSVIVSLPYNKDKSEVTPPESLTVPIKDLIAKFNADKEVVQFDLVNAYNNTVGDRATTSAVGKVRGHSGNPAAVGGYTEQVLSLMSNKKAMNELEEIVDLIASKNAVDDSIRDRVYSWNNIYMESDNKDWRVGKLMVDLKDLSEFIQHFDNIQQKFEIFGDPNISIEYGDKNFQVGRIPGIYEQRYIDALNVLSKILMRIQFCVTAISESLQNAYIVDKSRIGTVSTREQLSAIVYSMIKAGIPGKYISYNAYLLCTPELKGNKGDKNQPIWGQTRVVFYPKNDPQNVLKIAYNGLGISSNRSEYDLYKTISVDSNDASLLARTEWISDNGVLNTMELTDTERDIDRTDLDLLKAKLGRVGKKYSQDLCRDIHSGNVGYIGDRLVCIDYGLVNRKLKGYY